MKIDFDVTEVKDGIQNKIVPIGNYDVKIEKIEEKTTRNGGTLLAFRERIISNDPNVNNVVLFHNVNVKNANEVTERIARETLVKMALSAKIGKFVTTDQLLDKIINVHVDVDTYLDAVKNVVKYVNVKND